MLMTRLRRVAAWLIALLVVAHSATAVAAAACRSSGKPCPERRCHHHRAFPEGAPADRCPLLRQIARPDPAAPEQSFTPPHPGLATPAAVPPETALCARWERIDIKTADHYQTPSRHPPDARAPPVTG